MCVSYPLDCFPQLPLLFCAAFHEASKRHHKRTCGSFIANALHGPHTRRIILDVFCKNVRVGIIRISRYHRLPYVLSKSTWRISRISSTIHDISTSLSITLAICVAPYHASCIVLLIPIPCLITIGTKLTV